MAHRPKRQPGPMLTAGRPYGGLSARLVLRVLLAVVVCAVLSWMPVSASAEEPSPSPTVSGSAGTGSSLEPSPSPSSTLPPEPLPLEPEPSPSPTAGVVYVDVEPSSTLYGMAVALVVAAGLLLLVTAAGVVSGWGR